MRAKTFLIIGLIGGFALGAFSGPGIAEGANPLVEQIFGIVTNTQEKVNTVDSKVDLIIEKLEAGLCSTDNDCTDANLCTTNTCVGGTCQSEPINVTCPIPVECTSLIAMCLPQSGEQCVTEPSPEGTQCSVGFCDGAGTCVPDAGMCDVDGDCAAEPNASVMCLSGGCEYSCDAGFTDANGNLGQGGDGCETAE